MSLSSAPSQSSSSAVAQSSVGDSWDEITYLAYHLHWDVDRLLDLEHDDRLMLVGKVADLNKRAWEGVKQVG